MIKNIEIDEQKIIIDFKTEMDIRTEKETFIVSTIKKVIIDTIMRDVDCYNENDDHIAVIGYITESCQELSIFASNYAISNDEIYLIENGKISDDFFQWNSRE